MMSENNVAFGLERYDEICAIAFNRHGSPSPISKRLADFVGNYRHDRSLETALPDRCARMRRIELRVKSALSYPQTVVATGIAAKRLRWPH
jgi:hypothetical protein